MILLDTNVLYRLARVENCFGFDIAKIESFVNKHTCACATYAFFELLNSKFSFQEKISVLQYMKDHRIQVTTNSIIMEKITSELQMLVKNEAYYRRLKKVYGKYIFNEVTNNAHFFVISYLYVCLTVYLDNAVKNASKGRLYFRREAERIQKTIDKHIKKVLKAGIEKLLNKDELNAETLQVFLLRLTANAMAYYYQLLAYAKELLECNSSVFYYKVIKKFKTLKAEIKKDSLCKEIEYDVQCLSILKVLVELYAQDSSVQTSEVKKTLSKMVKDSIYYVKMDMQNEFEEIWLQQKIDSLLIEGAKIKPNDFMDYGILREAYYEKRVRALLTFDKAMIRTMEKIKNSEVFKDSVKIINEFKLKA